MAYFSISKRTRDFIDAADDSGSIKNNALYIQYLHSIDVACIKAGIVSGVVYPIVGGTAYSHSFNFLNPAQHQITWHGGVTHSNLGISGNAIDAYGDTNFLDNLLDENNYSEGYYSRTKPIDQVTSFSTDISSGVVGNSFKNASEIQTTTSGIAYYFLGNNVTGSVAFLNTSIFSERKLNLVLTSKINSDVTVLANNSLMRYNGIYNVLFIGTNVTLMVRNTLESGTFSYKDYAFFLMTNAISEGNQAIFSNDIFVAQRSLGRA